MNAWEPALHVALDDGGIERLPSVTQGKNKYVRHVTNTSTEQKNHLRDLYTALADIWFLEIFDREQNCLL